MQIRLKMEAGDCPTLNMNAMENYLLSQSLRKNACLVQAESHWRGSEWVWVWYLSMSMKLYSDAFESLQGSLWILNRLNEQIFSQQCWPEPGAFCTVLMLYTPWQSQILTAVFIESGPWPLSNNRSPQLNRHKTRKTECYSSFLVQLLLTSW